MSVGFNDPGAWGYCEYCIFMVAADPGTGLLLTHPRRGSEGRRVSEFPCNGSGREGTEPVPYVAPPRPVISLWKSPAARAKKAEWVKAREEALRKLREDFNVGTTANVEE